MPTIDHDPEERRPEGPWPWLRFWLLVALLWGWFFYFQIPNWVSVGIGFFTGMMFATWAMEVSGNRLPFSSRDKRSSD